MDSVLEALGRIGIVPVIQISDVEKAVPLAQALAAGGIPCAEVTFRTAEGEGAIRRICHEVPQMLVGAGTVLDTAQVDKALAAGAQFIVSPGYNPKVVEYCLAKGVPVVPGCATPSDMEKALEAGLTAVKFFPAEPAGGISYIRAVAAPYSSLRFLPTGGISEENLSAYLSFDKVLACGGSWMVKPELVDAGRFEEISRLCRRAVRHVLDFSFAHMGINAGNEEEAKRGAALLAGLFHFEVTDKENSVFGGKNIELMKSAGMGRNGHIGIATPSVERARYHLERQGVAFRPETERRDKNGTLTFIYVQDEVAGFAVHLMKK